MAHRAGKSTSNGTSTPNVRGNQPTVGMSGADGTTNKPRDTHGPLRRAGGSRRGGGWGRRGGGGGGGGGRRGGGGGGRGGGEPSCRGRGRPGSGSAPAGGR